MHTSLPHHKIRPGDGSGEFRSGQASKSQAGQLMSGQGYLNCRIARWGLDGWMVGCGIAGRWDLGAEDGGGVGGRGDGGNGGNDGVWMWRG
jgi:hypothetical protein